MKKKFILFLLFFFFINSVSYSFENKILIKIENEIITSIDILNEIKLLQIINPEIQKLDKNEIIRVAKNSLINLKIKEIEISKTEFEIKISKNQQQKMIENFFKKVGMKDIKEFENYLENFNLELKDIEKKINTELKWNEIIIYKYSSKININKNDIKNEILNSDLMTSKSYLLYEILFSPKDKNNIDNEFKIIQETIKKSGFTNAALMHSISNSSSQGGYLGWINESSLNKDIKKELLKLKQGEYSNPILTPGGFLVLMFTDTKVEKKDINLDAKIKEFSIIKANNQLNQFSIIYFNKIKKNLDINEL